MTSRRYVALPPAEASAWLREMLEKAHRAFHASDLEHALDTWATALGLALQLGPYAAEQVLAGVLAGAQEMADHQNANALSALGPALVDVVRQVGEASALAPSPAMRAWAEVASDLGAVIGQLGLVFTIDKGHCAPMLENARTRALLLDDATDNVFALMEWIERIASALCDDEQHRDHVA